MQQNHLQGCLKHMLVDAMPGTYEQADLGKDLRHIISIKFLDNADPEDHTGDPWTGGFL